MTVDEFIAEWHNNKDYCLAHTSGSTGNPKEIRLSKKLMLASAMRTVNYFSLSAKSHLHLPLSPDYIAGKMMILRSIISNASLSVEPPSNHLPLLPGHQIDLLAVVPSQLQELLDHPEVFHRIKNIIVGGSPLSPALIEKSLLTESNIVETYGMTETASHIALRRVGEEYFTPLPGIDVKLEEAGTLTIEVEEFGTFRTNDLAEILPTGRFRILGRSDDVIITGGLKVHPAEIEHKIQKTMSRLYPSGKYIITSLPDEKWGEKVALCLEGETVNITIEDLQKELLGILERHQIPRTLLHLPQFPLTSSGKIKRAEVKKLVM